MTKIEKLQNKVLEIWEKADDKKAINMLLEWFNWDYFNDIFRDSVKLNDEKGNLKAMIKIFG